MKKFKNIGKIISGLEFDKGMAALIGALGALGSLIFATISSARGLKEDSNEPIEGTPEGWAEQNSTKEETPAEEVTEETTEPDEA